ncbi:MAG: tetratricopeptide repeat protein [Anaerolineae bacterium]
MGKYFVPSAIRTPVDRLRESLDKAEQSVTSLRGIGPQALELPHLLDRITDLVGELEATGVDVRAEHVRFEIVQRQLRRRQNHFVAEAGSAFQEERAAVRPDQDRWWWFLDEAVAQQRQHQLRRTLTWGLALTFLCGFAWIAYDRFIAPAPELRQSFQHSMAGERLVEEGDLRAALAEFEAAAAITPDDPALWTWQGVTHFEMGELDEAQKAFDTARSLYETESDFLLDRGLVYLRVGDLDAASADVEQVITTDPSAAVAYYVRASVVAEQGDYAAAITDLERAAELAQAAGNSQLEATARVQRAMVMQLWAGQVLPTLEVEDQSDDE